MFGGMMRTDLECLRILRFLLTKKKGVLQIRQDANSPEKFVKLVVNNL